LTSKGVFLRVSNTVFGYVVDYSTIDDEYPKYRAVPFHKVTKEEYTHPKHFKNRVEAVFETAEWYLEYKNNSYILDYII
jgi:hypothetical protein